MTDFKFSAAEQLVLVLLGINPGVTAPEMAVLAGGRNIKNTHRILRTLVIAGKVAVQDGRYTLTTPATKEAL